MAKKELKWRSPEWHREHAIFGTDFSKTPAETIELIRSGLSKLRGQLDDIAHAYPGFSEDLNTAEGGITQTISYLYHVAQRMKEGERNKWPVSDPTP